jgi:hypothetical protein
MALVTSAAPKQVTAPLFGCLSTEVSSTACEHDLPVRMFKGHLEIRIIQRSNGAADSMTALIQLDDGRAMGAVYPLQAAVQYSEGQFKFPNTTCINEVVCQ